MHMFSSKFLFFQCNIDNKIGMNESWDKTRCFFHYPNIELCWLWYKVTNDDKSNILILNFYLYHFVYQCYIFHPKKENPRTKREKKIRPMSISRLYPRNGLITYFDRKMRVRTSSVERSVECSLQFLGKKFKSTLRADSIQHIRGTFELIAEYE